MTTTRGYPGDRTQVRAPPCLRQVLARAPAAVDRGRARHPRDDRRPRLHRPASPATIRGGELMADPRYKTARWQRLRKAVLAHYGYVCQVEGPRCTGYATTVHHLVPSSQAPHLFWEPANLVAACSRCNYGDGSRIAAENTTAEDQRPTAPHRRTTSRRSSGCSRQSHATKTPSLRRPPTAGVAEWAPRITFPSVRVRRAVKT